MRYFQLVLTRLLPLMRYLFVCLALLFLFPAAAQQEPAGRRKHALSRAFTAFKGPDCFQITRQEADQAFRGGSWDDAAALYRAAKSCADADQAGRSNMNLRIRACRDAAEQELLNKERAARRQARQAIASNRADDAQELLKNFDRGLAFRLADFANQYIAPEGEDNADCLQAMYDSWYYIPKEHTVLEPGFDSLRVALGYQLSESGSNIGIIQFAGEGSAARLYKLSPVDHIFEVWDAQTLQPEKPLPVDTAFTGFQVSPDGRTVAFFSERLFAFWQNGREVFRQQVPYSKAFAFSLKGEHFYYYDPEEKKIMSLDLRAKYAQQRKSNANVVKPPIPVTVVSGLKEAPAAFALRANTLWLGYRDSVVVCRKAGNGKPWQRSQTVVFERDTVSSSVDGEHRMLFFPDQEAVLVSTGQGAHFYQLPASPGRYAAWPPKTIFPFSLIGIAPNARLVAKITPDTDGRGNRLYLLDPFDHTFYFGSFLQPGDYFGPLEGTFSADGRWFAASNAYGVIKLWALADRPSERSVAYGISDVAAKLSPNGQHVIREAEEEIARYAVPAGTAEWTMRVTNKSLGDLVVANGWLAYFTTDDSLVVIHPDRRQRLAFPVEADSIVGFHLVAFDPAGEYVTYAVTPDSVVVRHLPDGALRASRAFSDRLKALTFLPDKNTLVVVMQNVNDYLQQQNVVKIWNFSARSAPLSTVRLHGYSIEMIAVSSLGDRIAFSDRRTVRVFDLDKLADEQASIRQFRTNIITSLAFQPDGRAIAAGYDDGHVIFWDAQNAQFVFEFKNASASGTPWIHQLAFTETGSRLRYLDYSNNLFERQLDPDSIRANAQTSYKQLAAFSPDQILQYNLEPALSYDRNFEVLASSDDGPLIRSFFEFYRQQALSSNNIEQVGIYCQRAFELYKRLDQAFRTTQRRTMLALYEDYSWKWLLRNNTTRSTQVVAEMNRNFDRPIEAVRAGAFTALLSDDLPTATRLFVNWLMEAKGDTRLDYLFSGEELPNKLRQLLDYDLLNSQQLHYLCTLFGTLTTLDERVCPGIAEPFVIPFEPDSRLRWQILGSLYEAESTQLFARQIRLQESALADARSLLRRYPESRLELEVTTLALANSYYAWGYSEQGNAHAADLYRRTIQLLGSAGKFRDEAIRQYLLALSHLELGNYQLNTNQLEAAVATYTEGLRIVSDVQASAAIDPDVLWNLYAQRGSTLLLLGKNAAARTDFEVASDYGLPPFYFGPISWLEGQTAEALAQYEDVFDEYWFALAQYDLQRLGEYRPEIRTQLAALEPLLRTTVLTKYPTQDTLLVGYLVAERRHRHYSALGQWAAALRETERAQRYAEQALNKEKQAEDWQYKWLDAQLTKSYYLLFVGQLDPAAHSQAIRTAEQAEAYISAFLPDYNNAALLKTNHAHALLLRDGPGDRAQAIALYQDFLAGGASWEVLQKDFRDLHAAGIQLPRVRAMIEEIKPDDVELTTDDWREMGVVR